MNFINMVMLIVIAYIVFQIYRTIQECKSLILEECEKEDEKRRKARKEGDN